MKKQLLLALTCAATPFSQSLAQGPAPADADSTKAAVDEAGAVVLAPVTVTAEKSDRSLMETSASILVLDQNDLERRAGLNTAKDVLANTPNIVYVGTGNIAPAVRGVDSTGASQGGDAFIAGSRSRLNMQIDGRPVSYNEIVFGDSALWDVQQVEVLRGAQSTLQGRNAIAGTIATKTNDPTFDREGTFRAAAGNYDQRRLSGMLSGPLLGDNVAYRLAADWMTRTSWVDGWEGFPTVKDPREFEALNLRGKLLFEPKSIEGLRTLLTLNHADYRGPQTEDVYRPFSKRETTYLYEPVFEPKTTSAIIDTQYRIDSRLSFEGLVTATDLDIKRRAEVGYGIATIEGHEYVVEPRLRFSGEGRTSAVAGVYLFRADQDETLDIGGGLAFDDAIRTQAIFGEGTLQLSPLWDLIVGARYERESHDRSGGNGASVVVELDETYKAFLPKFGLALHVDDKTVVGGTVSRGYNGGGAGAAFNEEADRVTNYQYDPEYVWTYELYGRKEFASGRARLTGNLFYSNYKDMQLTSDLTPADTADYEFVVENADKVETWGAETGLSWRLTRALEAYVNLGLLKAEISKYPNSGYQGNQLPNSPSFNGSAGLTWQQQNWDAGFNAHYSDSYYSEIANQPRGKIDPYWLANAQLGYTWMRLRLYGAVNNLFDSDKPLAVFPGSTPEEDSAYLAAPRNYWIGAQVSW